MLNKASLRKVLMARRQIVPNKESKNFEITQRFLSWFNEHNCKSIFTYVSINSEVDTKAIIKTLFANCDIYAPLTIGNMRQYKLPTADNLNADKHGNLDFSRYEFVTEQADIAIVPLLGFNKKLYRIGYGGGYYDKFLACFKGVKIGLAYDEQGQEFEDELHDVNMDIIITQSRIILKN